eukprot:CAMPEP_0194491926 /NCGR_PEP_ID=MMETSP0253-20130528/10661_1 /TAXON_ID=2966 /ORGANISM="Noctiluca scintillans" /LENGTH=81 /DNA_ID=CAMNT_0039332729 /DNA_START=104 /DNA_END=346 /DNA_ORIENTATION=-
MRPLRLCIEENGGDITRCQAEVEDFEKTCDKRLEYVHDRDGLDDTRSGMFSGKKEFDAASGEQGLACGASVTSARKGPHFS